MRIREAYQAEYAGLQARIEQAESDDLRQRYRESQEALTVALHTLLPKGGEPGEPPAMGAMPPVSAPAGAPGFAVARAPVPPPSTAPEGTSGMAIAGFVLAFFPLLAPVALVLCHLALGRIKRSAGRLGGKGLAVAGLALGYTMLAVLVLVAGAIVVPSLNRARVEAQSAAAAADLSGLRIALETYAATYPSVGYPASLRDLGTASGGVGPTSAGLVADDLANAGVTPKDGYLFLYAPGSGTPAQTFTLSVQPQLNRSGRYFFLDESGTVRVNDGAPASASSPPRQ